MMKSAEKVSRPTALNLKQMQKSRFALRSFEPTESEHETLASRGAPHFSYNLLNVPAYPPVQKQTKPKPNRTGMPDELKAGIESLSGIDMSDVLVHTNSDKPARLNALAYAQGNEIHLGPGQERHLPHEAWHVVQQKQGRVKPASILMDVVNNDLALEHEADILGEKAYLRSDDRTRTKLNNNLASQNAGIIQLKEWLATTDHRARIWKSPPEEGRVRYEFMSDMEARKKKWPLWHWGLIYDDVTHKSMSSEGRGARGNAKRIAAAEEREAVMMENAKSGKPTLHRGTSFEGDPDQRKKEIGATRTDFQEQMADQSKCTFDPATKEKMISFYKEMIDSKTTMEEIQYIPPDGRPVEVRAKLGLPSTTIEGKKPPEPKDQTRNPTDDRGHLVTESLVEESRRDLTNDPRNIVAENREANEGYKRGLELEVEAQLKAGKKVVYIARIEYPDETACRPSAITHIYVCDGNVVSVKIENP